MRLYDLTAHQLSQMLRQKQISAQELMASVLERIDAKEDKVRAYITVLGEKAMQKARQIDEDRAAGVDLSPLAGIPIAIKDNICTAGVRTTCASKMLSNFIPPYDATVMEKLNQAGLVMVGKANLDEFAIGATGENSAYYVTSHPLDAMRVPGGSSSGSAAAVAAGEAILALGTDTGGSVRLPASYCGLVGLKPTYGTVSRYGVVAYASSMDQVGPLTKDVTDCALILNVISGQDPRDATTSLTKKVDYTSFLTGNVKGMKIGVPKEYMDTVSNPAVTQITQRAIQVLTDLGAQVEQVTLPHHDYALPIYYVLAQAEASSNLARFDGVRFGYRDQSAQDLEDMYAKTRGEALGPEVKKMIMLGTYMLSAGQFQTYYVQAQKVRTLIIQDFTNLWQKYDLLLAPTAGNVAPKRGATDVDDTTKYVKDVHTLAANLAGLPAVSVPVGQAEGLPVGLQLIGPMFSDGTILNVAYALEQNMAYRLSVADEE